MINTLIDFIFWNENDKQIKKLQKEVIEVNKIFKKTKNYTLKDIKKNTKDFKELFSKITWETEEDNILRMEILDKIKFEAFAMVKRTCELIYWQTFIIDWKEKTWKMIPYDVQLLWWLNIHEWNISEMRTWEWKTLVATMPAYLNSLVGKGVHIVTVNDYLAKRDSEDLFPLYNALWLTVWYINSWQSNEEKKKNYWCDVVYATNNELWFDYLRDNMIIEQKDKVQWKLFYAIIDEIDSILIDESRTPLIISAEDSEPTDKYNKFSIIAKQLTNKIDFKIDEKTKTSNLTEDGIKKLEKILNIENIFISEHYNDLHHIENALKAENVYLKDIDYIVQNWEVNIVDEHTWRVLKGRRYWDWLHQAIEAKEKVEIKQESKTLASITFQNYFRLYQKLWGMTWTAKTEEEEFYKVYRLNTYVIPTNEKIQRIDLPDLMFKNYDWKNEYVVNLVKQISKTGRPILIWTVSIDKSEYISNIFTKNWIKHKVLNAKQHKQEAEIISQAGKKGSITIATNMAWRWTDIKLWEGVSEIGWLYIIWTEKHETRRIDNQLRGRAWRQWDKGTTQFLISPKDDIMRIFGWDKLFSLFNSKFFQHLLDDQPLPWTNAILTKKIESIQKQVEGHHFENRKNVLEYDDVLDKHRKIIYDRREQTINEIEIENYIKNMIFDKLKQEALKIISTWEENYKNSDISWKLNKLLEKKVFSEKDFISKNLKDIEETINEKLIFQLNSLKQSFKNENNFFKLEKLLILRIIDNLWMRHINTMTTLRSEVAFEGYAQKNPLIVYKEKAFIKFTELIDNLEYWILKGIFELKNPDEENQEKIANELYELLWVKANIKD